MNVYGQLLSAGSAAIFSQVLLLVMMFGIMYFLLIRPQKKREKEVHKMRANLEIGDEVITNGGIIGRVVSIKDDTVVIESGSDRSKIRFLRSAVQYNTTAAEALAAEKKTTAEAKGAK